MSNAPSRIQVYVKTITMKMYFGLFFAAFVFLYGVMRVLCNFYVIQIDVLLQMAIAALFIALLQVLLIPDTTDLSKHLLFRKSILWLLFSSIIIFIAATWGNWFVQMPNWTIYAFSACAGIGFIAMLIGLRLIQEADTKHLNDALNDYHEK